MYNRKWIRLSCYDYSKEGSYFVTINTYKFKCLFGKIVNGEMILNNSGKIVENELLATERIRKNVFIPIYVIMPNHIHFILEIRSNNNICRDKALPYPVINNSNNNNDICIRDNALPYPMINIKNNKNDNICRDNALPYPVINIKNNKNDNICRDKALPYPVINNSNNNNDICIRDKALPYPVINIKNNKNDNICRDNALPYPVINIEDEATPRPYYGDLGRKDKLGNIIGQIKSISSKKIRKLNKNNYQKIWHWNYYEHIIRNKNEYLKIENYIKYNPKNWR